VLKYLKRIEYRKSEDPQNPHDFTLIFFFDKNEYFENEFLSIRACLTEPYNCHRIQGCDIKWKAGKNVTKIKIIKRQQHAKTGEIRNRVKEEDCLSFFRLFKTMTKVTLFRHKQRFIRLMHLRFIHTWIGPMQFMKSLSPTIWIISLA